MARLAVTVLLLYLHRPGGLLGNTPCIGIERVIAGTPRFLQNQVKFMVRENARAGKSMLWNRSEITDNARATSLLCCLQCVLRRSKQPRNFKSSKQLQKIRTQKSLWQGGAPWWIKATTEGTDAGAVLQALAETPAPQLSLCCPTHQGTAAWFHEDPSRPAASDANTRTSYWWWKSSSGWSWMPCREIWTLCPARGLGVGICIPVSRPWFFSLLSPGYRILGRWGPICADTISSSARGWLCPRLTECQTEEHLAHSWPPGCFRRGLWIALQALLILSNSILKTLPTFENYSLIAEEMDFFRWSVLLADR